MRLLKVLDRFFPAVVVMLIIFAMSSATGPMISEAGLDNEGFHIFGHFLMYTLLCLVYFKATKDIVPSVVFTILFGVLDELHQFSTYLRNPSIFDIKVDTMGAIIGGIIIWKLQPYLPKILKNWLNN